MDSDSPTAHPVYQTPPTPAQAKIYYLGTTGQLLDRAITGELRDELMRQVGRSGERVAVLDLGGAVFSPGSLQELLLPLVRRLRSGEVGPLALIVIAEDPGVADFVRMLAATEGLPLYFASRPKRVAQAEPLGRLTPTERETMEALAALGGKVTVSTFAHELHLQITAAGNRLTNLTDRGYIIREARSRREGDHFVDPRQEAQEEFRQQLPINQAPTGAE